MELYQLHQFKIMAETGNMTKAAEKLCISQPALSMALKKMEAEFHLRFFDRQKNNIILNDAGKLMLKHATAILERVEEAQEEIRLYTQRENTFIVGFEESSPLWFFQSRWMCENDMNSLQCSIVHRDDGIESLLLNGSYDVIVATEQIQHPDLICKHLITDVELLAVPFSSPLAEKDVISVKNDRIPQIVFYEIDNHFFPIHMRYYRSLDHHPEILVFSSLAALLQFSNESSIPITASMLAYPHHPEFKDRKVLVLEDPELLMPYYIIYKKTDRAKLKKLIDYFFHRADEAPDNLPL